MSRILIVEDVEMNRDLLVQLLEDDHELIEAADGREGLEKIRSEAPDLVLLDMQLPEMDGYEITRAVRAETAIQATRIIAVTAHAMAGDQEKALAAGCDDYLTKPIDEEELWAKVEKQLSS